MDPVLPEEILNKVKFDEFGQPLPGQNIVLVKRKKKSNAVKKIVKKVEIPAKNLLPGFEGECLNRSSIDQSNEMIKSINQINQSSINRSINLPINLSTNQLIS